MKKRYRFLDEFDEMCKDVADDMEARGVKRMCKDPNCLCHQKPVEGRIEIK